jgi:hypothetical protein
MTSSEIYQAFVGVDLSFWLKEIAFQLAVMNERAKAADAQISFDAGAEYTRQKLSGKYDV